MLFRGAEINPSSSAASFHLPPTREIQLNLWSHFGHVYKIPSCSQQQWHTCIESTRLCLLWLFVVPLQWPKMREECGDGLCSSLAGQSHSAGPKSRDDPAGYLFSFTCQTLRTVKAWPEQSLLKQSPLQRCVLNTNGGRQRRYLCLMGCIFKQQLHKKIFTKQKDEQVKKQFRTILAALHSRFHWMPSPVCGPWGL